MRTLFEGRHAELLIDEQGVATLTLTGAKSLNILGTPAITALTEAIAVAAADPALRVLVLRGTGDKAFIGGADIHEMATLDPQTAQAFITRLKNLCEALRTLGVPVIARCAGWCLGAGVEVALACDLRLASTDSRYGMPEVHVGIPSVIHAALLPRLIGGARASWMLMTGDNVDARTALDWGLVHAVHESAALDAAVQQAAAKFVRLGPAVLRQQKKLLKDWEELPLSQAIAATVPEFGQAFATGEPQHYMATFINRPR